MGHHPNDLDERWGGPAPIPMRSNLNPEAEAMALGLRALRALRTKGQDTLWREWIVKYGRYAAVQFLMKLPSRVTQDAHTVLREYEE